MFFSLFVGVGGAREALSLSLLLLPFATSIISGVASDDDDEDDEVDFFDMSVSTTAALPVNQTTPGRN